MSNSLNYSADLYIQSPDVMGSLSKRRVFLWDRLGWSGRLIISHDADSKHQPSSPSELQQSPN